MSASPWGAELFSAVHRYRDSVPREKEKHMKQDQIQSIPAVISAAAVIKAAALEKGAGIPLLQNTVANIGADADGLTTTRNNHEQSKVVLAQKRAVLATSVGNTRAFLTLGRDILKPIFGNEYSQAYDVLGLVGSIAIPRTSQELLPVLQAFKAYFVANPASEDDSRDITALQAQALYDQLLAAQVDVNDETMNVESTKTLRDAAADQMRKRIRMVIDEMTLCLSPLDPRWLAFGFKMPGAQERPEAVEGFFATLVGPTTAALKWSAAPRAEYYRVWMKVHGSEAEYVAMGSPADLDFNLENLPANSQIDVVVTAVNNGGESQKSDVITITTTA